MYPEKKDIFDIMVGPEDIMLNEINQTEKQIPHNPTFMRNPKQ